MWKTTDGGTTWDRIFGGTMAYDQAIYNMSWVNEKHGVVITDKVVDSNGALNTILYTEDGGETWNTATVPGALPDASGRYIISDIRMNGLQLWLGGRRRRQLHFLLLGIVLYRKTAEKTWYEDETLQPWRRRL